MDKMYPTSNETIIVELQKLATKNGGLLQAKDVVESARPKSSPLHSHFEWDDSSAARKFRLYQARELIGAVVRYIDLNGDTRPVRVFVSLTSDRHRDGGYRNSVTVLGDKNLRAQMLADALDELHRFEKKYSGLKELSGVFVASKKVRNRLLGAWAA